MKKKLAILAMLLTVVSCKSVDMKNTASVDKAKVESHLRMNEKTGIETESYQTYYSNFGYKTVYATYSVMKKGMAHPEIYISSVIYNAKNEEVKLNDILKGDLQKALAQKITEDIKADKTKGKYFDDVKVDLKNAVIVLEGPNIHILFPPYVLGPYSSGILEFTYDLSK